MEPVPSQKSGRASSRAAPKPTAPPDTAVLRFRADLDRLEAGKARQTYGIALSGGPDSLALLLLAHAAIPDRIEAATVDHGLRAEAAAEAAAMVVLCQTLNIPHVTLRLDPADRQGNVSDWARRMRYAALNQWQAERGIDLLVTAHHADDQLETLLMRLNRGSGVAGLAGVRAARPGVIRPLLGWRKAELKALVAGCGLVPVDDPSNHDDRYDRARLRKALELADWLDPLAAARSAKALSDAEEALVWMVDSLAESRIEATDTGLSLDPTDLPVELCRRLLDRALRRLNPAAVLRGGDLDRLCLRLGQGETATLAGVRAAGGTLWQLTLAAPHRPHLPR